MKYLDREWDDFETHNSGTGELGLVLIIADNNAHVIEQKVLRLLLLGDGGHETDGVSSRDIAQLVVAHSHRQTV